VNSWCIIMVLKIVPRRTCIATDNGRGDGVAAAGATAAAAGAAMAYSPSVSTHHVVSPVSLLWRYARPDEGSTRRVTVISTHFVSFLAAQWRYAQPVVASTWRVHSSAVAAARGGRGKRKRKGR
jgi:hypothetical protein